MTVSQAPCAGSDNNALRPGPSPPDPAAGPPPGSGAPPGLPARRHHLLWLRAVAALADSALMCGLFAAVGLATGGGTAAPAPPGTFRVSAGDVSAGTWWLRFGEFTVAGWWLALYLAMLLLYYFALEASTGQTLGKRLLGLRVQDPAGNPAPAGAIARRTLLRLIDWLPLLYLTGFITTLATGSRRKRLGDLAGGTAVTADLSARNRHPGPVLALSLLVIAGLSVSVTTSRSGPGTPGQASQNCQAYGIAFDHPAGWRQAPARVRIANPNLLCRTALFIGQSDAILIEAYPLTGDVTARQFATAVTRNTARLLAQIGGAIQTGPRPITLGGLPALEIRGTGLSFSGARIHSTLVFAHNATTIYFINCQNTPEHAAQVKNGCDQILRTFTLTTAR